MKRQKRNMKYAQSKELSSIEESQRSQFNDFTKAWDTYMKEYEETALGSLHQLKEAHAKELQEMKENLKAHYLIGNRPVNKEVIELKEKEKVFLSVKKYNKAERTKRKWQRMEEENLHEFMMRDFRDILVRESKKLKSKQ